LKILKLLDDKFEEYFLAITLSISVVIIFLQIIMRYVVGSSLSWSEELARYLFLWQIWVGASFAVKRNKHLRADVLQVVVPQKLKYPVEVLYTVIWLAFSIFLAYQSSILVSKIIKVGQLSAALRLPMQFAYASVPTGCILMTIRLVQKIILDYKKFKSGGAF